MKIPTLPRLTNITELAYWAKDLVLALERELLELFSSPQNICVSMGESDRTISNTSPVNIYFNIPAEKALLYHQMKFSFKIIGVGSPTISLYIDDEDGLDLYATYTTSQENLNLTAEFTSHGWKQIQLTSSLVGINTIAYQLYWLMNSNVRDSNIRPYS